MNRALRGSGIKVSYVTALGTERYSERIFDAIHSHDVGIDCIERRDNNIPGLYAIDTDDHGERSFSYWRSNSAARTLLSEPCVVKLERLNDFDLVLLSGLSMAILPHPVRQKIFTWANQFRADGPMDLASGETPAGLPQVDRVVDSTVAGDSFNAGFLVAVVLGQTDVQAAHAGTYWLQK